jgi:hypothetical protein
MAGRDTINGQPIIPFIKSRGFDGAVLKLERAFAPDWADMAINGALGTINRFGGKFTSVPEISGATAKLTASSWMILLNSMMPRNLYQTPCMHTVYDAGCGLNPASFVWDANVSGPAGATLTFTSTVGGMSVDNFALGRIVFVTGANAGLSATIRSNTATTITLVKPLPNPLAAGDFFHMYPGCDLTRRDAWPNSTISLISKPRLLCRFHRLRLARRAARQRRARASKQNARKISDADRLCAERDAWVRYERAAALSSALARLPAK